MNRILLITKNDFEGIASAILLKYIHGNNIDTQFYSYKAPVNHYQEDASKYEMVIAVGLKNASYLNIASELLVCNCFEDLYVKCNEMYPEDFNNPSLDIFKENVTAYIDWSWAEKRLYFGKNIDELSKYLGKQEIIDKIAERISLKEEIVKSDRSHVVL